MNTEIGLSGPEATRRFLGALCSAAPVRSVIELPFRVASRMGRCFHDAASLDRVAQAIQGLASSTEVFVELTQRTGASRS